MPANENGYGYSIWPTLIAANAVLHKKHADMAMIVVETLYVSFCIICPEVMTFVLDDVEYNTLY